jgi:hypothetical protein
MVYLSGFPHVVFEWERQPDGSEMPVHTVSLDPNFLHKLQSWGDVTYMYEKPIQDPRPVM